HLAGQRAELARDVLDSLLVLLLVVGGELAVNSLDLRLERRAVLLLVLEARLVDVLGKLLLCLAQLVLSDRAPFEGSRDPTQRIVAQSPARGSRPDVVQVERLGVDERLKQLLSQLRVGEQLGLDLPEAEVVMVLGRLELLVIRADGPEEVVGLFDG